MYIHPEQLAQAAQDYKIKVSAAIKSLEEWREDGMYLKLTLENLFDAFEARQNFDRLNNL